MESPGVGYGAMGNSCQGLGTTKGYHFRSTTHTPLSLSAWRKDSIYLHTRCNNCYYILSLEILSRYVFVDEILSARIMNLGIGG